jgi:CCR4-NOT complex subunit CAF16
MSDPDPSVRVRGLSFRYAPDMPLALDRVELDLHPGSRCLLVGANGAGKSTLLRVLSGMHMVDHDIVRVLGRPAFHDPSLCKEVVMLGDRFPFDQDVPVHKILAGALHADADRRDELIVLLGVDTNWRMHALSDGQRRRVQVLLGLLREPRVLLLDEVTTDLDVIARDDLLQFLRRDCEQRDTTILYATHIFDTLDDWATHIAYVCRGRMALVSRLDEVQELKELRAAGVSSPLNRLITGWLRSER